MAGKQSKIGNMRSQERAQVAAHQRRRFNELVDAFDTPQTPAVMERLREVVAAAGLRPGEVVLDVGTGVGVLVPLIESYRPSAVFACDLAERMLQRVHEKYPEVRTHHADITVLRLGSSSVDAIFMNAMFGNIADKPRACQNAARMLRTGGRLIVSHPEGRAFVDQLRVTSDLFIESFPDREGFQSLLSPVGLDVITYRDEPQFYLMVARKRKSGGNLEFRSVKQ
jgi:SAM-dependent methyltransferase